MDKALVIGGNVSGNIGSCAVTSTNVSVNSFVTETVAVNSCTGTVVADHTYIAYGDIIVGSLLLLFLGSVVAVAGVAVYSTVRY